MLSSLERNHGDVYNHVEFAGPLKALILSCCDCFSHAVTDSFILWCSFRGCVAESFTGLTHPDMSGWLVE